MTGTRAAIVFAALALSACGSTSQVRPEPRIVIQEKLVPVTVPCVPDNVGAAPQYPDTDDALKQATPDRRYQLVIAGRDMRNSRLGVVEPVIQGCRK